jgi:hypothetical protein
VYNFTPSLASQRVFYMNDQLTEHEADILIYLLVSDSDHVTKARLEHFASFWWSWKLSKGRLHQYR